MNKLKIKKSVSKRFKVTPTGKLLSGRSFGRHLKLNKSKSRLRRLKTTKLMTGRMAIKIKKALGTR